MIRVVNILLLVWLIYSTCICPLHFPSTPFSACPKSRFPFLSLSLFHVSICLFFLSLSLSLCVCVTISCTVEKEPSKSPQQRQENIWHKRKVPEIRYYCTHMYTPLCLYVCTLVHSHCVLWCKHSPASMSMSTYVPVYV